MAAVVLPTESSVSVINFTDVFRQFSHFGDTTGVIGNRAVCIDCNGNARGCQHADSGQGDTIDAHFRIGYAAHDEEGDEDGNADEEDRQEGGIHAYGQTSDDDCGMTGFGLIGNLLDGRIVSGSVDFGELANQQADDLAGCNSPECVQVAEQLVGQECGSDDGQDAGHIGAGIQGPLRVRGLAVTDVQDADDGSNDTAQGQQERISHACTALDRYSAQGQGGNDGAYIGFEQVSAHAGDVADVIADVVGDGGRVTRIVFRDAGFYLAYEVSAYVSGLGVDTAADTGEQGNGAGAQTEARDDVHVGTAFPEDGEGQCDTGDAQTYHGQAHDGAAGEGDLQSLRHTVFGSAGRADVGAGCDVHAAIAGQDGEDGACHEADGGHRGQEDADDDGDDDDEDRQSLIFTGKERHSAFVDMAGNFLHQRITGIGLHDGAA